MPLVAPVERWYHGDVRFWGCALLVCAAWALWGVDAPALADSIKKTPNVAAPAEPAQGAGARGRSVDRPLDDDSWRNFDPEFVSGSPRLPPSQPTRPGPRQLLPFVGLCAGILIVGLLVARSLRQWRPADVALYLERTGAPWGRREDLFLEKLVLELRLHRASELTKQIALQKRFDELDKLERPLREMRARYRAVRREYRYIALRIGPVRDGVREECAQNIRRSGLVQSPPLSPQEDEALRRLALAIERQKRAPQPAT